jgi:hypothetical protein
VPGTQGGSRRLPGGAEGIRNDGHHGLTDFESRYSQRILKHPDVKTASANYVSQFARKPQISLAFAPSRSNGPDVPADAPSVRGLNPADETIGEFLGPARLSSGSGLAVVTARRRPNLEDDPDAFSCQTY